MSNGLPWSMDDDQYLRDLAQSGLSPADIANQMNRSASVVYRHARMLKIALASGRNGITTLGRPLDIGLKAKLKWTFKEQRRFVQIAASSKSFDEVVDRTGRSKAIRKMALRLGISLKFDSCIGAKAEVEGEMKFNSTTRAT